MATASLCVAQTGALLLPAVQPTLALEESDAELAPMKNLENSKL